jgi:hypothetical protein
MILNEDEHLELSSEQIATLLHALKARFENHRNRHSDLAWERVQQKLEAIPAKLWSLNEMERTGGEPDVVNYEEATNTYTFFDCSPESPKGRRSLCYDRESLESRKEFKPNGSAIGVAHQMGVELLTEQQYRYLQSLGHFDTKTSSWLKTPDNIRQLGGSIFGDYRFDTVFIYHNGAESYYASRGFRSSLQV